jgi:hypothetical protein
MLVSNNRFIKQGMRIVIAALGLSIIAITSHAGQVGSRKLRDGTDASANTTATEFSPMAVTYTITSNQWVSDQLNVYGTLTNVNVKMEVIGLDESQQVVTESRNCTIQPDGYFRATMSDPRREIRFLKVVLDDQLGKIRPLEFLPAPIPPAPSVPVHIDQTSSGNASDKNDHFSFGGFVFGLGIIVVFVMLWQNRGSFVTSPPSRSVTIPAPTPSALANQRLALAALKQRIKPNRYQLSGFLPKKGENIVWAFMGVKHYHQGTHSQWVGQSVGASVKVCRGLWLRSGSNRGHKISHSEMDYQGVGTLVLTTLGICFLGENTTRLPLSRILAFKSYSDGIGLDTDYARNNRHLFYPIHESDVVFIKTAIGLIKSS